MTRALIVTLSVLSFGTTELAAQRPGRQMRAMADRAANATPQQRERMEQQLRAGMWRIAKQRVGFSDDQMTKLETATRKFEVRRRDLMQRERTQRQQLRQEVLAGDAANQDRIAASLDELQKLQRERLDVLADEQRELATFMTPLQRAKYMALQEQVRRRLEALRRARPDSMAGDPRP